jgi:hypothetical protein
VKSSFKNVSHGVHKVFKVSVSSSHLTTECTENKHLGDLSVASARCLSDLREKFFAFLQPSMKFMTNPGSWVLPACTGVACRPLLVRPHVKIEKGTASRTRTN